MYNNDTQEYEYEDWLFDGDWYEDEEGLLYILSVEQFSENEGPDNKIMKSLNTISREHRRNPTEAECIAFGLTPISPVLKRFTPEDGYYHA